IANDIGIERVLGVILVVHEHEGLAILVGIAHRAPGQFGLLDLVIRTQGKIGLDAAWHAVHDEAEGHIATATLRRTALDIAHLIDLAVVFNNVAALYFGCFHGWEPGLGIGDSLKRAFEYS